MVGWRDDFCVLCTHIQRFEAWVGFGCVKVSTASGDEWVVACMSSHLHPRVWSNACMAVECIPAQGVAHTIIISISRPLWVVVYLRGVKLEAVNQTIGIGQDVVVGCRVHSARVRAQSSD